MTARFLTLPLLLALSLTGRASEPVMTSASFSLLPAETGAGGGSVSGGTITADISVGDGIAGGFSRVTSGGVQAKSGYTGQLYDATGLALSADPSTDVNEGNAVQLAAAITMDDETLLNTSELNWSIIDGPVTEILPGGIARAGSVITDTPAQIEGAFDTLSDTLDLNVLALPFQSYSFSWDDPQDGGPYRVLFGTDSGSLTEVATTGIPFYEPGQLDMGSTYYWQVFDSENNNLTPGGGAPVSFTTSLFQADAKIGRGSDPLSHRGDGIYNTTGTSQLFKLKMKGKKKGTFHFSVENDGDTDDTHSLLLSRPSRKFKFVRYFALGETRTNITGTATRAGYGSDEQAPGESALYQVQAKGTGKKTARQTLRINTASQSDLRGADAAVSKMLSKADRKKRRR